MQVRRDKTRHMMRGNLWSTSPMPRPLAVTKQGGELRRLELLQRVKVALHAPLYQPSRHVAEERRYLDVHPEPLHITNQQVQRVPATGLCAARTIHDHVQRAMSMAETRGHGPEQKSASIEVRRKQVARGDRLGCKRRGHQTVSRWCPKASSDQQGTVQRQEDERRDAGARATESRERAQGVAGTSMVGSREESNSMEKEAFGACERANRLTSTHRNGAPHLARVYVWSIDSGMWANMESV